MTTKTIVTQAPERMTFWEKLYLPEIAKGLGLTLKQSFGGGGGAGGGVASGS